MPQPCGGHTTCEHRGKLYVFGGGSGTHFVSELHVFDLSTARWQPVRVSGTAPQPRSRHTAAFVGQRMFVLFGGDDSRVYDDVHVFDAELNAWQELATSGSRPGARWGHTMCVLPDRRLVVFGGHDGENMLNDLHILDTASLVWTRLHAADSRVPPPRAGHTASMVGRLMLVFGGGDGDSLLNDTWSLTLDGDDTPHWQRAVASGAPPSARCAHTSVSLPSDSPPSTYRHHADAPPASSRVLVFGGGDGARRFKDVYVLDVHRLVGGAPAAAVKSAADAAAAPALAVTAAVAAVAAAAAGDEHDSPSTLPRAQSGKARHSESLRRHDAAAAITLRSFLERIGLSQFHDAFAAQDIDVSVLPSLTEAHLRELGVGTIGARLRIISAAKELPTSAVAPPPAAKRAAGEQTQSHVDQHALLEAARALDGAMRLLGTSMANLSRLLHAPAQVTAMAAAAQTVAHAATQINLAAGGAPITTAATPAPAPLPTAKPATKQQFSPKKNGKH